MRRRLAALLAATLVAAGCSSAPDVEEAAPTAPPVTTIVPGTLTACVAPGPAGDDASDVGGFDVAVLEALADGLALELDLVERGIDDLVAGVALNSGACDVAAAGVVDRPMLEEVVTTSRPYRTVHRQLVALAVGPQVEPATVTEVVGVEEAGPAAASAAALTAAEVVPYPSRADLGRALGQGAVTLALVTVGDRQLLEEQLGASLALRGTVPTDERNVLLLPLDAPEDLREEVDGVLSTLEDDGTLEELVATWLRS